MRRRSLLKLATLAAGAATPPLRLLAALADKQPPIARVLVVFKCHLDVGFTQTQAQVMRKYFDIYYPAAIERAAQMRAQPRAPEDDRYIWTTGSWLLYEYLEQATPAQRAAMERAIAAGDITWHALPFSWQTEMLDRSMIEGALGLSADLDRRFGRKTIAAKMTDVPGHTRGIVGPLHDAGIRLFDIGINAASFPPDVPDVFLWKDAEQKSIIMLYHRHDYGSVLSIPGSDLAIAVEVRNDNSGPHTVDEISAIYARLRAQFPGAHVQASNFNDVALAVEPFHHRFPVVTQEIGDTWIYGIPSDPPKVARYREVARLRQEWLGRRSFIVGDTTDRQLLRRLLLSVEHTWGTDTKSYLDNQHYRPADLAAVLDQPGYRTMQTSWQEKRDDLDAGIATLPEELRTEAVTRLASLTPAAPSTEVMHKLDLSAAIENKHFSLTLDPNTGAITSFIRRAVGSLPAYNWASTEAPLALFTYQTFSAADFAGYLDRYVQIKADWAPRDFGKPGIEAFNAQSRQWHPKLLQGWTVRNGLEQRIVLHLRIDDPVAEATGNVAWPANLYFELTLADDDPSLHLRLTLLGKRANRLPEAMWLTFAPPAIDPHRSTFNKVDETFEIDNVLRGGGRAMHAVHDRITLAHSEGGRPLQITTLDAPVIALGQRSPLNFSPQLPSLREGIHVSLYNNAWGTNYPQWASGDWSYRFSVTP